MKDVSVSKSLRSVFFDGGTRDEKPTVDFDNDGVGDMFVCQQLTREDQAVRVTCHVFSSKRKIQKRGDGWVNLASPNFGDLAAAFKLEEVRFGDIDHDGDIDIAAKVTGGAILVWHNRFSSPSK